MSGWRQREVGQTAGTSSVGGPGSSSIGAQRHLRRSGTVIPNGVGRMWRSVPASPSETTTMLRCPARDPRNLSACHHELHTDSPHISDPQMPGERPHAWLDDEIDRSRRLEALLGRSLDELECCARLPARRLLRDVPPDAQKGSESLAATPMGRIPTKSPSPRSTGRSSAGRSRTRRAPRASAKRPGSSRSHLSDAWGDPKGLHTWRREHAGLWRLTDGPCGDDASPEAAVLHTGSRIA